MSKYSSPGNDKPNNESVIAVDLEEFNQLGGDVVKTPEELTHKLSQQVRRAKREREARKTAEKLLEEKSLELYNSNQKLRELAGSLQEQVDDKTKNLEKALEEAKNATLLKSQFIATISHEMRTPLNAIIGFSDRMLTNDQLDEPTKLKYTGNISSASQQLLGLINDVLDFEKIASGKLEISNTQFNVKDTLDNIIDTVSVLAEKNNINVGLSFDKNIPDIITSDSLRFQQVSYNLLSNALKFSKNNFVAIECRLYEGNSDYLEVVVADQGIGMSEEHLENLFSPFTQADGSMARKYGGSGLGLSICKSLVDLMGGRIWAESKLGEGSQFHFIIKLYENTGESDVDSTPEDTVDLDILNGAKLLLVDDQMLNQELGKELLEDMGCVVELADDGNEAIDMVLSNDYDAILMDLQMPECDGLSASKAILLEKPAAQIIALTANATSDVREQCISTGMVEFIGKPFIAFSLFSTVAKVLLENLEN